MLLEGSYSTYMICGIETRKRVRAGDKANKKGQRGGLPLAEIEKRRKDLVSRLMRAEIQNGYNDRKEPQEVQQQKQLFNLRKVLTKVRVDQGANGQRSPKK